MLTLLNNSTELRYSAKDEHKMTWRRPVPSLYLLFIVQSCDPSSLAMYHDRGIIITDSPARPRKQLAFSDLFEYQSYVMGVRRL